MLDMSVVFMSVENSAKTGRVTAIPCLLEQGVFRGAVGVSFYTPCLVMSRNPHFSLSRRGRNLLSQREGCVNNADSENTWLLGR